MRMPNMVYVQPRLYLEIRSDLSSPCSPLLSVLWYHTLDTVTDMACHSSSVLPWAHFTLPDSLQGPTLKTRRAAMLPSSATLGSASGSGRELSPTFL